MPEAQLENFSSPAFAPPGQKNMKGTDLGAGHHMAEGSDSTRVQKQAQSLPNGAVYEGEWLGD